MSKSKILGSNERKCAAYASRRHSWPALKNNTAIFRHPSCLTHSIRAEEEGEKREKINASYQFNLLSFLEESCLVGEKKELALVLPHSVKNQTTGPNMEPAGQVCDETGFSSFKVDIIFSFRVE